MFLVVFLPPFLMAIMWWRICAFAPHKRHDWFVITNSRVLSLLKPDRRFLGFNLLTRSCPALMNWTCESLFNSASCSTTGAFLANRQKLLMALFLSLFGCAVIIFMPNTPPLSLLTLELCGFKVTCLVARQVGGRGWRVVAPTVALLLSTSLLFR